MPDESTQPQPTPSRVVVHSTETISDEHFLFERIQLQNETFAGGMSRTLTREVLRSGKVVVILLYDPFADRILLTQQFRIGACLNGIANPWLLECVAGMVDQDEASEAAARREVKEETGCEVRDLQLIGEYLTSPGITDELSALYVARFDVATAGGVHGLAAEAEDIRTQLLSREQASAAAANGSVRNVMTQIALLWFQLHGAEVQRSWLEG